MNFNLENIESQLCESLCANIRLRPKNDELTIVETPFFFADGDPYQIYIKERPGGILRLSDMGHTLMHLSYENDIDKFNEGTRGALRENIITETGVAEEEGEFYVDTTPERMVTDLFKLTQALTKIQDLTFLNRARVESTFYEDLKERIYDILDRDSVTEEYYYEEMDNAHDYPIDYRIEGRHDPLYLFGVGSKDKAQRTTIVLERLLRAKAAFDSIIVFSDMTNIPRSDLSRLVNAGGEMISSLDAESDLNRKLTRKAAVGSN